MILRPSILKWFLLLAATALLPACAPREPVVETASPTVIRQRIESATAPLVLVHVWATWCDPCREEFPELMKVQQQFADDGLQLLLVSADNPNQPEAVEAFLAEQQCHTGSLIATELNEAFIEAVSSEWKGSLPATFFYQNGKQLAGWEGKRSFEQYAETIGQLLNPDTGDKK